MGFQLDEQIRIVLINGDETFDQIFLKNCKETISDINYHIDVVKNIDNAFIKNIYDIYVIDGEFLGNNKTLEVIKFIRSKDKYGKIYVASMLGNIDLLQKLSNVYTYIDGFINKEMLDFSSFVDHVIDINEIRQRLMSINKKIEIIQTLNRSIS